MISNEPRVDDLRLALTCEAEGTVSTDDVELVQRAVAGELGEDEFESLLDRLHLDPALAEAWRTAVVIRDELTSQDEGCPPAGRGHWYGVMALAAVLLLAVAVPSLVKWRIDRTPAMRETPRPAIETALEDGAALPRDAFDLAWRVSADHGLFRIKVLNADLKPLHQADEIQNSELRVPAQALTGLEPGSTVLWWVETTGPSGHRLRSPTFVQTLE